MKHRLRVRTKVYPSCPSDNTERVHVLCEFNDDEGMCVSCVEIIKNPFTSDPITKLPDKDTEEHNPLPDEDVPPIPLANEPDQPKSELDPEQQQEPGLESNSICVDKDDGDDSSSSGDGGYPFFKLAREIYSKNRAILQGKTVRRQVPQVDC